MLSSDFNGDLLTMNGQFLKKTLNHKGYQLLLLFFAGLITPMGFSPFSVFVIPLITVSLLLSLLWKCENKKQAFAIGFIFGLGCFATGVYWIDISLQQFGGINGAVAILLTLLFIMYLSCYPALACYLCQRFFPKNNISKLFCAFPFFWMLTEWVRGFFFNGFPWLSLGYSQTNSYLSGYATIAGVYGVSLVTLWCCALIVLALHRNNNVKRSCAILFVGLWIIGAVLSYVNWTTPDGKSISISMIQGNIPQSLKWSPKHTDLSLQRYTRLTAKHWNSQLIVWPETAIPLPSYMLEPLFASLNREALKHHSSLITGALIPTQNGNSYYNGLIALGKAKGEYYKRRLVPFGEFLPNIFFVNNIYRWLQLPAPGLTPGPVKQKPVSVQGITVSPFICYEIAFPEQVRIFSQHAGFLLTISDDAWFGESIAPWQHLQMAQMRAIETGRMVAFASNSGITALIDAHGHIVSKATPYQVAVLSGKIQAMKGQTPWQRVGLDAFIVFLLVLLFIAAKIKDSDRKKLKTK